MALASSLFALWRSEPPRRPGSSRLRRRFRPRLELLEDRLAPAILTVNTLQDGANAQGYLSLRKALTVLNSQSTAELTSAQLNQVIGTLGQNDTIVFEPDVTGTVTLTAALPQITANVQILGPGPASLTISGGPHSQGATDYQIFNVASQTQVTIAGLTLADGSAQGGGAIYNAGDLSVNNCVFGPYGNAINGGAIYNTSLLTVTNSSFVNNGADYGGAIYSSGSAVIEHSSMTGNQGDGGGVYNSGNLVIENSSVTNNFADFSGGGIYNDSGGTLLAQNDTFAGNTATYKVGGAIASYGDLTVAGCTLANNTGGGGRGRGLCDRERGHELHHHYRQHDCEQ